MNYHYLVGPKRAYTTVEGALAAIKEALATTPVLQQDVVIAIEDGSYPGFTIENGLTYRFAKDNKRLIIKPAFKGMPLIDAKKDPNRAVGIDVGSDNPNVTICGLHVRGFVQGVRVALNSHYCRIQNCLLALNRSAGIFSEHANWLAILQNVVIDGNVGIFSRFSHGLLVVHNTVYLDGKVTYTDDSPVGAFIQLHDPYGVGRGEAWVYGNIFTSKDLAAEYFHDDLAAGALHSNYNLFYSLSSAKPIQVSTDQFYSRKTRISRLTVADLMQRYGVDGSSINDDPQLQNSFGKGIHYNDLLFGLKHTSPAIARIDRADLASFYPSWLPTSVLTEDITARRREAKTALGAMEQGSIVYLLNTKFHHKWHYTGLPYCDENWTTDVFTTTWKLQFPTLNPGFFYSFDREYYLYAQKSGAKLGDLCCVSMVLPQVPVSGSIYIDGQEVETTLVGDRAIGYAKADHFYGRGRGAAFVGWDFSGRSLVVERDLDNCEVHYFLPDEFVPNTPVIVTDDLAAPGDPTGIANQEFIFDFNDTWKRYELTFPRTNLFWNPRLYEIEGSGPTFWDFSGTITQYAGSGAFNLPPVGELCAVMSGGYLGQRVDAISGGILSCWAKALPSGAITPVFRFELAGAEIAVVSGTTTELSTGWERYYWSGEYVATADAVSIYFSIDGAAAVAGPQWEAEELRPFNSKPLPSFTTVEFETSTGVYQLDLAVSPYVSYNLGDTLLAITEVPAKQLDFLASNHQTTLFDWRWTKGRLEILPWARTRGKDKLLEACSGMASRDLFPAPRTAVVKGTVPEPLIIEITPTTVLGVQGDEYGFPLTVAVADTEGNDYAFGHFAAYLYNPHGLYCGLLGKKYHGLKEQAGSYVVGRLTSYGTVNLIWVPPDESFVRYHGRVPLRIGRGNISQVRVKYPVYPVNAGNPVIYGEGGEQFSVYAPARDDYLKVTRRGKYGIARTVYPMREGSVAVFDKNGDLLTQVADKPTARGEYAITDAGEIMVVAAYDELVVHYQPRFVFMNKKYPETLFFYHNEVFGGYDGKIAIDYAALIVLTIKVRGSTLDYAVRSSFPMVALPRTRDVEVPYSVTRW